MSIMDKLKRLISGASGDPAEQAPMQPAPHPEQAQSSKAGDNESRFSESDILAVKQHAETVTLAFNEALSIADQSKDRGTREYKLQIAREWLVELKKLANKFPFLHLETLQAVEAHIIAVEAETRSLPYGQVVDTSIKDAPDKAQPESLALQEKEIESPERSGQDQQRLSASDEQAILMCIQSCFRVVNESIVIARKSKNLDTKLSRLRVARDNLKEAQRQASQFSLEVGGFNEAEAEINRIDEAIKAGTPTEIAGMPHIEINDAFASPARDLLKEATALKKEKKFAQACSKLREAYSAEGSDNLMIEDRLRLPMYLQLAGQNDEGWDELNRLDARYVDQFSEARIRNQMRIFLQKEKNETASNPVRVISRGDNKPLEATSAAVRQGIAQGETQTQIFKRVNEVAGLAGRNSKALVHTAIMQVLNDARMATFKANANVTPTTRWLSTLDSSTCPVCGVRDGKEWDTLTLEPVGHSLPFISPPIHVGCRCTTVGITRLIKYADAHGIGQRASMFGPVKGTTTFAEFLDRQSPAFQDEVLGKGRAEIYREGKLTLDQLVDGAGRELTLAELCAKYSK